MLRIRLAPFCESLTRLFSEPVVILPLEIVGYTADELVNMLDRLNAMAIQSVEFGMPILPGRCYDELKGKVADLKERGLTKTQCTYLLAEEGPQPAARPMRDSTAAVAKSA